MSRRQCKRRYTKKVKYENIFLIGVTLINYNWLDRMKLGNLTIEPDKVERQKGRNPPQGRKVERGKTGP